MASLFKKGLSDSKYYLIATIGNKLLAFLVIPFLAKSVGVEEFATYDLFLVASNFLNILIILGIDSGIAIFLAKSKSDERLAFLYVSSLLISLSMLMVMATLLHFVFLYKNELFLLSREIWILILLYVLFNMITYHTFNFLRWRERAKEASFISLFAYVFGMFIGLISLYLVGGVEAYLFGLVIGVSIGSLVSLYIARDYIFKFKIIKNPMETLRELFKISLPFIPNYLGNSLMQMADRVIILMLFGKYELGVYAIVVKLAKIPQIIIGTVSSGFKPIMFKNYETRKGVFLIRNFFHAYLIFIPILFVIALAISKEAVMLFGGEQYVEFAYLFPIALVSILFVQSSQAGGFGYILEKKTHYIVYITFISVVLNYILSFIFGYILGIEGVIIGTLLTGIFKTYINIYYSEKLHSFNYNFGIVVAVAISSCILILLEEFLIA